MEVTKIRSGNLSGSVCRADVFEMLESISNESADILFLDPPFNLGKEYSSDQKIDMKSTDEYERWLADVVDLSMNKLKPGGALFLYHLPIWALRIGAKIEKSISFRHWISISMKNGFARGNKLYPAHYALLYFTRGEPNTFSRPKVDPVRCRSCGEFIRDYGGYKKIMEKSGVNLSDFWDDLSPVRHKRKKHRQSNELPMDLFRRILSISGKDGMTYVDPFAGSGSGAISAFAHKMNFIVGDLVQENTKIIIRRLKDLGHQVEECHG